MLKSLKTQIVLTSLLCLALITSLVICQTAI